jgi:glucuronate isomerase
MPTWRTDRALAVEDAVAFNAWVEKLAGAADLEVRDFESYLAALRKRQSFFHQAGCRLADHGMENVCSVDYAAGEIAAIFRKVRAGRSLGEDEILKFKSAMLYELGIMNHEKGWVQQFHIGAMHNNSSRAARTVHPNTGCDAIGDSEIARPLAKLLDRLDKSDQLSKTILYNVNPRDNVLMVSIMGCFQDGSYPGKMQLGSAWWFLDQRDGIERQIDDLSRNGLLSRFVGMVTDGRSFLSFARHEYFRRILCNILGSDMAAGRIPRDFGLIGGLVRDVCCNNAGTYFGFDVPAK